MSGTQGHIWLDERRNWLTAVAFDKSQEWPLEMNRPVPIKADHWG